MELTWISETQPQQYLMEFFFFFLRNYHGLEKTETMVFCGKTLDFDSMLTSAVSKKSGFRERHNDNSNFWYFFAGKNWV